MEAILSDHHISADTARILGDLVDTIDGDPLTLSTGAQLVQLFESCGWLAERVSYTSWDSGFMRTALKTTTPTETLTLTLDEDDPGDPIR